ncbi:MULTISPECIES: hypothetical protein [unclassified Holdemanella]|uniref:hypothetical protein n=1 Tax=unclassified Holdemanella TaxID=2633909 RepID=UPI001D0BCA85|nr:MULTISPECIES: hypothetical protein [unclassified Holdemanella]MCB8640899.1 hypothetical protein [Holdemanella sp. DFI.5.55]MCG5649317.1 hypothetical protein [Holdemanella sp. DFI.5.21]
MNLDEAIASTKEASESQRLGELGRETALQLAAWLEELKQYKEENQPETNLDHYKHEILENCMWNLAVVKRKPKRCNQTRCSDCEFDKDTPRKCHKRTIEWLKQPYKAPAIKLTKFEYDLLQSCSQGYTPKYQFKNINCLTEMKEKGHFKGANEYATIEDILANCDISEEE